MQGELDNVSHIYTERVSQPSAAQRDRPDTRQQPRTPKKLAEKPSRAAKPAGNATAGSDQMMDYQA